MIGNRNIMAIMDVQYVYCKTRQEFGKQCTFDFDGPIAIENIEPNRELRSEFIPKNPCHIGLLNSKQYAVHEVQAENIKLTDNGMLHCEGGWPNEVNFNEEEATTRFRKRVLRSDIWAETMKNLMIPMEHVVKQNNAINIYENYFDEMIPSKLVLPFESRVVNTYADPQLNATPVSNISWSRRGSRMIVCHCSLDFQKTSPGYNAVSYVWAIENPVHPLLTLKPEIPSVTIECNPRHSSLLVSGQMTGQVAYWDLRTAGHPIAESHRLSSHSDPASIVSWIDTKTHCEFASGSTDGLMKWWDIRKIGEPTQTRAMDLSQSKVPEMIRSVGISSMNYSPVTGTKFIVGLENGIVINGSSKARTDTESLGVRFKCHSGPVFSVHRNPFIPKIFMTVGDWTCRIWAEDTKESCLASTEYRSKKDISTGGCWSNSRLSVFYVIRSIGELEIWDLLSGLNKPVETLKLSKDPLTRIRSHENGKYLAIGNQTGSVYLVESSEALTTNRKNDKAMLTAYLENSGRYEKSVDNRLREMRYARLKYEDSGVSGDTTARKNVINNKKWIDTSFDQKKVEIDVPNQNLNKKTGAKVENATSFLLDFDLIESEKKYFALVQEESKRYGNLGKEDHPHALVEHKRKEHHRHRVKHGHKSYKSKEPRKKYKRADQTTDTEPSLVDLDASQTSEIKEEVIKPNLPSPKSTKSRKGSPKPCALQVPSRICRPEICCWDVQKASTSKGKNSVVKGRDSISKKRDSSPRKTEEILSPISATIPALAVGDRPMRFEKYHQAHMTEVKDFSEEAKAEILKRATARPSTLLLEVLLAKKRVDEETERIRLRTKKEDSGSTDKDKVTEDLIQVKDAQAKIDREYNNKVDRTEDVEPGSSPTVRSVQGGKTKQQKLSLKAMKNCVFPRKALTALQVVPTEVFKPLSKLTERLDCVSQKESYDDRMYPGSSAFPPLPRIVLPKLPERPPDPVVDWSEESGNSKKMKRKVKSGVHKAEKCRSPNN